MKGNGVPTMNRLFVRLTISVVQAINVTQISISERWQSLSGNKATCYGMYYRFNVNVSIPSYSGRPNGVPLLWKFFVRLTFLLLQGFEDTHPIFRNFDDVANTGARCCSPLSAKRQFSLPNAFEKPKFDLYGSESASWQIWLRIESF